MICSIASYRNPRKSLNGLQVRLSDVSCWIVICSRIPAAFVSTKDMIIIFPGAKFPYVLRRYDHGGCVLVGEAFVHGIMYGKYFAASQEREMEGFVLKQGPAPS